MPTTDFYITSRAAIVPEGLRVIDTSMALPGEPPEPGARLVLVRQAPQPWLQWVARHADAFSRICYLMDDDMPAALASRELPVGYAWRTARRHRDVARLLAGICDEFWLSTPELLARYPGPRSLLCEPLPPVSSVDAAMQPEESVYFYHGTRAHMDEIRWLVPVVARVQQMAPYAVFEIFGDARVARLFAAVPRVRVRPWMNWPDYQRYRSEHRFRVGLAPCLDTPFNRARAPVKFFDITRMGAAGVYADLAPYAGIVRHGQTGLLCAQREGDWVEAILGLLADPNRYPDMAAAAREACEAHRRSHLVWPGVADGR